MNKTYIIEITDAEGHRHYPIEDADGIGKTTIERSDSPAIKWGRQKLYLSRAEAERNIPWIRLLAEAKGERSTKSDKPTLPVDLTVVPWEENKISPLLKP